MRTEALESLEDNWTLIEHEPFMGSGSTSLTPTDPAAPNQITTSSWELNFLSLSLSILGAVALSGSYVIFMALCYLSYTTSPWYLFPVFITLGLITKLTQALRKALRIVSNYRTLLSTSGTS